MIGATPGDRRDARGHFLDELRATFAERGGRPALIYRDRTYSFAELDRRARRCAAWLQGLGVEKGDRVVLATAEKLPFLAAHLGVLYAGGVSLPLNPRFTREEMRYFLADSGARVAVVGPRAASGDRGAPSRVARAGRGRGRRRRLGGARGPAIATPRSPRTTPA